MTQLSTPRPREYFTQSEAAALVGKKVTTRVEYSAVPKGTHGVVTRADNKPPNPLDEPQCAIGVSWIRPGLFPLTDWFSKADAEHGLVIDGNATPAEWDATGTLNAGDDQRKVNLRGASVRCRRCGRGLRNPQAMAKGIGKTCERKEKKTP